MDADGEATCGSFVEGTLPSSNTEYTGAGLGERMGGGAADARTRAGDDDNLAGEVLRGINGQHDSNVRCL